MCFITEEVLYKNYKLNIIKFNIMKICDGANEISYHMTAYFSYESRNM